MRIAVIGAGGVGGYFGGRLAQAGHDVTFVARGRHLAAMRERGLVLESALGNATIAARSATDDPAALAPCDVVMFCVKLWDVESTARKIAPLVAGGGVVIPFQNGLEAPEVLKRVLGPDKVLGGVAYIAATIREPGIVAHTGTMARLVVGAFDDIPPKQRSALPPPEGARGLGRPGGAFDDTAPLARAAAAFRDACAGAGVDVEVSADIRRSLWEKFCFLSALSGTTALARQPIGVVRGDPDLRAAFEAAAREAWTLGRKLGVPLADDAVSRQLATLDALPAEMRSSMLNDLVAGNRLEAPWLSGAVARMSAEAGLAAPVSATLYAAVKPYVDGGGR